MVAIIGGVLMFGALLLALRWTFGTGRDHPAPPVPDATDRTGDGLLEEVSRLPTEAAAQVLRTRLGGAGIRATIGRSGGAFRLLVFRDDALDARAVLNR